MSYTGGDRAEFGIIENIEPSRNYGDSYDPEEFRCIRICEEAINDWYYELSDMKTFWCSMDRPATNIARYGDTLIPPESLDLLMSVIRQKTRAEFMADALEIIELLEEAKQKNKFVILYDV